VGYQLQDAKIVSFTGSTAGGKASYSNALKLKYTKQNAGGCNSDFLVLLAKDIGLVGLEFAETCMPAGTFKLYVDSQAAAQSASNAAPAADATVEQPSFDTTTPSMQESVQDDVQGLGE
jgi:hypothetical protein